MKIIKSILLLGSNISDVKLNVTFCTAICNISICILNIIVLYSFIDYIWNLNKLYVYFSQGSISIKIILILYMSNTALLNFHICHYYQC